MNCLWAILVLWAQIELWSVKHVAVFLVYPITVRYMSSFILTSKWACVVGHLDKKISNCLDHSLSYFITFKMSHHWTVLMHWMQSYSLSNMLRFFLGHPVEISFFIFWLFLDFPDFQDSGHPAMMIFFSLFWNESMNLNEFQVYRLYSNSHSSLQWWKNFVNFSIFKHFFFFFLEKKTFQFWKRYLKHFAVKFLKP